MSSLEQQLAGMSASYLKNKEGFKSDREIEKLKENKRQLELIKNSLELESGKEIEGSSDLTGTGMRQHTGEIADQEHKKKEYLNKLIYDNSELLGEVFGVEHVDDISKNNELQKEFPEIKEHVDEYKKRKEEVNELDKPLLKKLDSLGIDTNNLSFLQNYSYKKVIDAIDKGLAIIDSRINQIYSSREEERIKKETEKGKIDAFISKLNIIQKELPQDEDITFTGKEYFGSPYDDYRLKIKSIAEKTKSLTVEIEFLFQSMMTMRKEYDKLMSKGETRKEKIQLEEKKEIEAKEILDKRAALLEEMDREDKKLEVVASLVKESPEISKAMDRVVLKKITGKPSEIFNEFKEKLLAVIEKL